MIETGVGVREVRNYIDGGWVDGGGASFESRDPATGDLVATAVESKLDDLSAAIDAARRTFDDTGWPTTCRQGARRDPLRARPPAARGVATARRARRARDGQADPLRSRARDRAGHRSDPVLRRRRPADPRRGHEQRPRPPPQPRAQGAGRRLRAHHAVERPGRSAAAQDRRGDRDRLHVRAQAGQRRARRRRWRSSSCSTGSRPAAGRGQRRRRPGRGRSARRWQPIRASTRSASPAAARSGAG